MGRPTKYKPEYCKSLIDFFSIPPVIPKDMTITKPDGTRSDRTVFEAAPTPYLVNWAIQIGVSDNAIVEWTKKYEEFNAAYKRAKMLQENFLVECAVKGLHNPTMTLFWLKNNCGYRDVREFDHGTKDGKALVSQETHYHYTNVLQEVRSARDGQGDRAPGDRAQSPVVAS